MLLKDRRRTLVALQQSIFQFLHAAPRPYKSVFSDSVIRRVFGHLCFLRLPNFSIRLSLNVLRCTYKSQLLFVNEDERTEQ